MGCTFCATGTMNLLANLTTGEILEQLYLANRIEPITNVVFMGMGEPLDNYDAVVRAINCMTDEAWFGLSKNKVTLSTVGVAPRMEQLAREAPHVNLALSLHAPSQELRASIMPAARAFPLPRLLAAMDYHIAHCSRHVLVQYVLLGGVNDSDEAAHELGALLKGRNVILNLIPYNPTNVGIEFKTPTEQEVEGFQKNARGTVYMSLCARRWAKMWTRRADSLLLARAVCAIKTCLTVRGPCAVAMAVAQTQVLVQRA